MYITVKQAAEKWNISDSSEEKPDAYQEGRAWKIPYNAIKPTDWRYKITKSFISILKEKLVNDKLLLTRGFAPLHNYFSI